jgi:predicted MFS family arabinose efflux permease
VSALKPPSLEIRSLRDLSPQQWKSGIAAWLGWLFDGLDMHLYVLVAAPFVALLIGVTDTRDPAVGWYSSLIQAAFLIGWALGGGFFGRVGDRLGRSRALSLTILTYASFTGLSFLAQTWWQLLIFRFVAALGIGGEWAVGASLLSETWPKHWRPWIAATLQTGVNIGVLLATLTTYLLASVEPRYVFLVGVLPALLVFWIRRAVPETEEWDSARKQGSVRPPAVRDLFGPQIRKRAVLVILVCSLSLTGHWAFLFWFQHHLRNLPDVVVWTDQAKTEYISVVFRDVIIASIVGNFAAAALAKWLGYRKAIALLCLGYFLSMTAAYATSLDRTALFPLLLVIGLFQGVFGLFTMYLPPLFPTLLRTTGAGFCYNIGRIVAAFGTVLFGMFSKVGDYRLALLYAGFLFLPAAGVALLLPELAKEGTVIEPSGETVTALAD